MAVRLVAVLVVVRLVIVLSRVELRRRTDLGRDGAVEIARLLLDAGGDPGIRDDKYDATVLGWAEFCGQDEVAKVVRERGGSR